MQITTEDDLTHIYLTEQEEGFLNASDSLIHTVMRLETYGERICLVLSTEHRLLVIPNYLLGAFLHYRASNAVEVLLQSEIDKHLSARMQNQ